MAPCCYPYESQSTPHAPSVAIGRDIVAMTQCWLGWEERHAIQEQFAWLFSSFRYNFIHFIMIVYFPKWYNASFMPSPPTKKNPAPGSAPWTQLELPLQQPAAAAPSAVPWPSVMVAREGPSGDVARGRCWKDSWKLPGAANCSGASDLALNGCP